MFWARLYNDIYAYFSYILKKSEKVARLHNDIYAYFSYILKKSEKVINFSILLIFTFSPSFSQIYGPI